MANSTRPRWLRFLLWIFAGLLSLPILAYLVLLLSNLRDDPLSPKTLKLLAEQPATIAPEKNGYFAFLGLNAPENEDPHAWGMDWQRLALADDTAVRGSGKFNDQKLKTVRDAPDLRKLPCAQAEACLAQIAVNPDVAHAALLRDALGLKRGDAMLTYPDYQEAMRPDFSGASQFPDYASNWNTLSSMRFALGAIAGKHSAALAQLEAEIAFYTRQISGSSTLIHYMVALAGLQRRYSLLGQYIQQYPDGAKQNQTHIVRMLAAPPRDSVSLRGALLGELRLVGNMMTDVQTRMPSMSQITLNLEQGDKSFVDRVAGKAMTSLFLPGASINEHANETSMWLQADRLEGAAYRQALADAEKKHANASPFALRNPMGHILVNIGPTWSSYFARRDDALALRSLLLFQLDLVAKGIGTPGGLAQALDDNKALLIHPYSGELPVWDAEYVQLAYPATTQNKERIVAIRRQ